MKLSDYKGEDAIELLADILEPAMEIIGDESIKKAADSKMSRGALVKMVLKNHKKAILEIMARIDGEDPATYNPGVLTLPARLLELFNDEEFMQLFTSQDQKSNDRSSGPVTEVTRGAEK